MKTVNLLLGNSERGLNRLVEAVVLDACYNQAAVDCTRIGRVDEFIRQGSSKAFQLIVFAPDNLLPTMRRRGCHVTLEEVADGVRAIKSVCSAPMLALCAFKDQEMVMLEAGVDNVLWLPFNTEQLRAEVRRVLRLPVQVEESAADRGSFVAAMVRGWQRLVERGA